VPTPEIHSSWTTSSADYQQTHEKPVFSQNINKTMTEKRRFKQIRYQRVIEKPQTRGTKMKIGTN
jgi:hypothetical protein